MFTLQHFMWLLIGLVLIAVMTFLSKKKIISIKLALNILLIVSIISETINNINKYGSF
ncbi:MAG: hypothetical protein ACI4U5_06375 [Bacilli bacterium]